MDPGTNENDVLQSESVADTPTTPGERSDLMRPEVRDRILVLLAAAGRELPYMRFGQLVCAMTTIADAAVPDSIYDIEDAELLSAIDGWLVERQANR